MRKKIVPAYETDCCCYCRFYIRGKCVFSSDAGREVNTDTSHTIPKWCKLEDLIEEKKIETVTD